MRLAYSKKDPFLLKMIVAWYLVDFSISLVSISSLTMYMCKLLRSGMNRLIIDLMGFILSNVFWRKKNTKWNVTKWQNVHMYIINLHQSVMSFNGESSAFVSFYIWALNRRQRHHNTSFHRRRKMCCKQKKPIFPYSFNHFLIYIE